MGFKIDIITYRFGLQQLHNEPTHLSFGIVLISTSQPNLVMESGVLSPLCLNFHHDMTYAKFNLKIYFPPP